MHPLTIMVSMFLAIPFGIVTLLVLGQTLNIYSIRGLFLLMGVVKKNAILQVDYTNVLRQRGLGPADAQMQADRPRLRPILMTTLAIIAGMLPVALGKGDGSASGTSLATAVVGGHALCLLVTLLMTPVIYSTFDDLRGLRVFSWITFPPWKRTVARRVAWGQGRALPAASPGPGEGSSNRSPESPRAHGRLPSTSRAALIRGALFAYNRSRGTCRPLTGRRRP